MGNLDEVSVVEEVVDLIKINLGNGFWLKKKKWGTPCFYYKWFVNLMYYNLS